MEVKNVKIPMDDFLKEREEVLASWPTGKDIDFEEAVKYQLSIPEEKRFGAKLWKADEEKRTLIQPRAGVLTITLVALASAAVADPQLITPNALASSSGKPPIHWWKTVVRCTLL